MEEVVGCLDNMMSRIWSILTKYFVNPYFGFIEGHSHLDVAQLRAIEKLVGIETNEITIQFECSFAKLIGEGECISYAAGRMGFYELMNQIGIGKGDEVILPGATCAVMANAVLRIGATPVYADVDSETYGSSAVGIKCCVSEMTKMIVAQHSFGIPCEIDKIKEIAEQRNIFLMEDCALALGSKLNGVIVGNFGAAALFSTDHSKPLNTVTGGMIYTKNKSLATKLRSSQANYGELPLKKQRALWKTLLRERKLCNARHYGKMGLIGLIQTVGIKFFNMTSPFLSEDFSSEYHQSAYPYPARLPTFLAQVGLYELKRWRAVADLRQALLKTIKEKMIGSKLKNSIPKSYNDVSREIIPLRFVWHNPDGEQRRKKIGKLIHVEWTWFMQPIIATKEPLENFGYIAGSCPISESIGPDIINLPTSLSKQDSKIFVDKLEELFS